MDLRLVTIAIFICSVAYILFAAARIGWSAHLSKTLVAEAHAYQRIGASFAHRILVLGDSTAVGVGAPPHLSVAARLGDLVDASVENLAQSGATTVDLVGQIARARESGYDLVLLQIGANDVIRLRSLARAAEALDKALGLARAKSDRVLILTAGDIGNARIFPWPINWLMSARTRGLREQFMRVAAERHVVYVDIYARPDPFNADPARYYAPDGLHLTGDGYGFWFGIVRDYMREQWPELTRRDGRT